MLSREGLIEWIKVNFKLNSYEASVWLTLLERGESTAGDISKYSGVPRARVYDILISLEKKGFIISKLSHPIKYVAVHPMSVIENLKRKLELEYAEKILSLEKLKETKEFKAIVELYKESTSTLLQEPSVIKGRNKIYLILKEIIEKFLDRELIISSDSSEEIYTILDIVKRILSKKDEKVKIVLINNEVDEKYIKNVYRLNVEKKKRPADIGRFIVIDGEVAFLFSKNYDEIVNVNEDVAILVRYKATVTPLVKLVEKI